MTRDADSRVRAFVLATFPATIALLWPHVNAAERPLFFGAIAWIAFANAAGYLVPWHRFPRWFEMSGPMSTLVALVVLAAPAGGLAHGYAMMVFVPVLWLALYADPPDIAFGMLLAFAALLLPLDAWFKALPEQGTPRQTMFVMVQLTVIVIGIYPSVRPMRDQIRRTRRAVDALHASQATLAHDLRNPLAAIRSLSTLTQQRLEHGEQDETTRRKLAEYAEVIMASTDRAERVIDGVLELSRAGEELPWVDEFELPALVNEVAAGMPDVLVRTSQAPRSIIGHRPSITRLVANLLENAALHARDDGGQVTVTVSGRELPAGWIITVADDGRGFEPGEADSLFEPWRRGSESATVVGSGLGLAIVAGIVEQHGGTISATNDADGGAAFTFTLARRPNVAREHGDHPAESTPVVAPA